MRRNKAYKLRWRTPVHLNCRVSDPTLSTWLVAWGWGRSKTFRKENRNAFPYSAHMLIGSILDAQILKKWDILHDITYAYQKESLGLHGTHVISGCAGLGSALGGLTIYTYSKQGSLEISGYKKVYLLSGMETFARGNPPTPSSCSLDVSFRTLAYRDRFEGSTMLNY